MNGARNPTKFLVVDDDSVDREVVRRGLRKAGSTCLVVEAEDGAEALEILRGTSTEAPLEKPYVVILDLNMPRMNGFEFLDRMRRDPDLQYTPTFVLTTSSAKTDKERAYRKCIAGYIVKSHQNQALVAAMAMIDRYTDVIEQPA